jgi:hypothetical protein
VLELEVIVPLPLLLTVSVNVSEVMFTGVKRKPPNAL